MSRTSEQVKQVKNLHDKYKNEIDFDNIDGRNAGASLSSTVKKIGSGNGQGHYTSQPKQKPSDELGFIDNVPSPKSESKGSNRRTTKKRAMTKQGGIPGVSEENDGEDDDYDDCETVDGVQVGG